MGLCIKAAYRVSYNFGTTNRVIDCAENVALSVLVVLPEAGGLDTRTNLSQGTKLGFVRIAEKKSSLA